MTKTSKKTLSCLTVLVGITVAGITTGNTSSPPVPPPPSCTSPSSQVGKMACWSAEPSSGWGKCVWDCDSMGGNCVCKNGY